MSSKQEIKAAIDAVKHEEATVSELYDLGYKANHSLVNTSDSLPQKFIKQAEDCKATAAKDFRRIMTDKPKESYRIINSSQNISYFDPVYKCNWTDMFKYVSKSSHDSHGTLSSIPLSEIVKTKKAQPVNEQILPTVFKMNLCNDRFDGALIGMISITNGTVNYYFFFDGKPKRKVLFFKECDNTLVPEMLRYGNSTYHYNEDGSLHQLECMDSFGNGYIKYTSFGLLKGHDKVTISEGCTSYPISKQKSMFNHFTSIGRKLLGKQPHRVDNSLPTI